MLLDGCFPDTQDGGRLGGGFAGSHPVTDFCLASGQDRLGCRLSEPTELLVTAVAGGLDDETGIARMFDGLACQRNDADLAVGAMHRQAEAVLQTERCSGLHHRAFVPLQAPLRNTAPTEQLARPEALRGTGITRDQALGEIMPGPGAGPQIGNDIRRG